MKAVLNCMIAVVMILAARFAFAEELYFDGATSGADWNTAANWRLVNGETESPNPPATGDTLHFAKGATVNYTGDFFNEARVDIGYNAPVSGTDWPNAGTGTLNINGSASFNTLSVGLMRGNTTGSGALTVNGNLTVTGDLYAGRDGAADITVIKPASHEGNLTVSLGTGNYVDSYKWTSSSDVWLSHPSEIETTNYWIGTTTANFSAADKVEINVNALNLGASAYTAATSSYKFRQGAKLILGKDTDITVNRVALFDSAGAAAGAFSTKTAEATEMILGSGTTNFNVAKCAGDALKVIFNGTNGITIGGKKASAFDSNGNPIPVTLSVAAPAEGTSKTAVVNIRGLQNGVDGEGNPTYGYTDLKIAYNYQFNTGDTSYGTVDLTNAAEVNMDLQRLVVAFRSGAISGNQKDGSAVGVLKLPDNSTVNVKGVVFMSYKDLTTFDTPEEEGTSIANSLIEIDGANSSFNTTSMIMGNVWGDTRTDNKAVSNSTLRITNGATYTASNFTVARGEAKIISSADGSGEAGDVKTASLYIGYKGATTTSLLLDSPSERTVFFAQGKDFYIGEHYIDGTKNLSGTFYVAAETLKADTTLRTSHAHFEYGAESQDSSGFISSGVENLYINVDKFEVGVYASTRADYVASGNVYMATNNTVTANSIIVSDNEQHVNNTMSNIEIGEGTNVFNAGTVIIGGRKSDGTFTYDPVTKEGSIGLASELAIRSTSPTQMTAKGLNTANYEAISADGSVTGYKTGSFTLNGVGTTVGTNDRAQLYIAKADATKKTVSNCTARIDLTNAQSVTMNLETLDIAHGVQATDQTKGNVAGLLALGNNATVSVYQIMMSLQTTDEADNTNFSELIIGDPNSADGSNHSVINVIAGTYNGTEYTGSVLMGSSETNSVSHMHMYNGGAFHTADGFEMHGTACIEIDEGTLTAQEFKLGSDSVNCDTDIILTEGANLTLGAAGTGKGTATFVVAGKSNVSNDNSTITINGDMRLGTNTVTSNSTFALTNSAKLAVTGEINIHGQTRFTITDSTISATKLAASSIEASGTAKCELTLNGTTKAVFNELDMVGDTNFVTDLSVAGSAVLRVTNSSGTGGIIAGKNSQMTVSGGYVILDKIELADGVVWSDNVNLFFTHGRMSVGTFGKQDSAADPATCPYVMRQQEINGVGDSVFAPGYASEAQLVETGVYKGTTRVYGNYALDSGRIELDIDSASDRDHIWALGNHASAEIQGETVTTPGSFEINPSKGNFTVNIGSGVVADYLIGTQTSVVNGEETTNSIIGIPLVYSKEGFTLNYATATDEQWTAWARIILPSWAIIPLSVAK